ncbi:hypothetical protein RHSIM_Rhsim10G0208000 [Rhododendron simsii]|uniref:SKP1-like protein n=1 Tax=Rhododendron simsii TaxID=118357 RepID=A0A834G9D9_RHOSS|nr:hypothetical protein RHSIM_Rhsim10G0208300 [Rhododendron simsii]KAF7130215.1 hypothetical protein RHSIM_Rhsim10G0208000 [Rhododendron simsii]
MTTASKKITLKSSDGEAFDVEEVVAFESQTIKDAFEVEEVVAFESQTIKDMICADRVIPLPNVTSKILAKVIEYCKKHVETPNTEDRFAEDELETWDAEFVKVDQPVLFDLILAANYLNIKSLLDLTCQTVADMIKGKTPDEIRKTFNIKNDFTPDEEEEEEEVQVRRENQWAFGACPRQSSPSPRYNSSAPLWPSPPNASASGAASTDPSQRDQYWYYFSSSWRRQLSQVVAVAAQRRRFQFLYSICTASPTIDCNDLTLDISIFGEID